MESPKRVLGILFLTVLFISVTGFTVWIRTATVNATYLYLQEQKKLHVSKQALIDQKVRWLGLTSPVRIKEFAQSLRMHPPSHAERVRYEKASAKKES